MRFIPTAIAIAALTALATGCNLATPPAGADAEPTDINAYEMHDTTWVAPAFANASIRFTADGRYGGGAACNSYGGSLVSTWPAFEMGDDGVSTLMICDDDAVEVAYFKALRAATKAVVTADGALVLSDASGPLIRYVSD